MICAPMAEAKKAAARQRLRRGLGASAGLLALLAVASGIGTSAAHAEAAPSAGILTVYAAGTLAVPFKRVNAAFEKLHPGITIQPQFGGSLMMARRIADLHQNADVFASADYAVIPAVLGKAHLADWFLGFASNEVALAYTPASKGAAKINADNWYKVVAEPGVVIGRSSPDTDPSGYQFLQMLSLANGYYHKPDLEEAVLKNAPRSAVRDTETSLLSALQLGDIDYLAIYSSSAIAHHLEYVHLPAAINLGDPVMAEAYARGTATTGHGVLSGRPIIYAATIPKSATRPRLAAEYLRFLVSAEGRKLVDGTGLVALNPPLLDSRAAAPATLRDGAGAWPKALAVSPK